MTISPGVILPELEISDICRRYEVRELAVFGSAVRGQLRPDSDIDLLVVMPDGTDRHAAAVAMRRQLADMPIPKDVIVTTPREIEKRRNSVASVLHPALIEGKVLHERI